MTYMQKEQEIDLPIKECQKLIKAFEQNNDKVIFTKDGFIKFMMFSLLNGIVENFKNHIVYQKMTEPLCHYWIDSSHNTYVFRKLIKSLA